jgi:hypothetical protein
MALALSDFYSYSVDVIYPTQRIQYMAVIDTYEIPADFQGEAMTITGYGVCTKKIERRLVLWARGKWIFRDIIKRHIKHNLICFAHKIHIEISPV